ncbi:MAG TPA: multidrug resistance efflux transporter family protein [Gemmatimonadaceae bacterium]|nr:multidrug resistance efflux transporter family protein [Gemmatimonadaceae bacterium]
MPRTSPAAATRALLLSVAASAFFSVTFVLNRSMALADGHWAWSSSLRFYLMLPFLAVLLTARRQWGALGHALRAAPRAWLVWGTVGFTVFYAALTAASEFAPGWLVAGLFELTIVAGLLLSPVIYTDHRRRIPRGALVASIVIVLGVLLLQLQHARTADGRSTALGLLLVLVAAFTYPLGNRKMMLALEGHDEIPHPDTATPADVSPAGVVPDVTTPETGGIDTFVRLTGMTLGSLPAWLLVSMYGYAQAGPPAAGQVVQAGVVALSSGIVATWLFFAATDMVRRDPVALAGVEAVQAAEVAFALVLEVLILGTALPGALGLVGLAVIVAGIVAYARLTT